VLTFIGVDLPYHIHPAAPNSSSGHREVTRSPPWWLPPLWSSYIFFNFVFFCLLFRKIFVESKIRIVPLFINFFCFLETPLKTLPNEFSSMGHTYYTFFFKKKCNAPNQFSNFLLCFQIVITIRKLSFHFFFFT
jgi:hypothetical protein